VASRCLSSCCFLLYSFPRLSRVSPTPLTCAETHSECVLHVSKTFLEPLAKAVPSQRSCNERSRVDKLLHKASRGGVCRTASEQSLHKVTRAIASPVARREFSQLLHRITTTTQDYARRGKASHSRCARSHAISQRCLRLPLKTPAPQQTPRTKLPFSIPPLPKHIPPTPQTTPLATHRRDPPLLPYYHLSLKTTCPPLSPHPQWHPPARTTTASPDSATASAQRSTTGAPSCAACCPGDPSLRGMRAQQAARLRHNSSGRTWSQPLRGSAESFRRAHSRFKAINYCSTWIVNPSAGQSTAAELSVARRREVREGEGGMSTGTRRAGLWLLSGEDGEMCEKAMVA
jgi:hypothetical protein